VYWGEQNLVSKIVFKTAGKNNIKIKKKREFLLNFGFPENRFWFLV